ncbi:MAG: hypothetical protein ACYCZO_02190 [Daejeonella sp.]
MEKILLRMQLGLSVLIALFVVSCDPEKLSDVMVKENLSNVSLSLENKIVISNGNNFTIDNSKMTIPVTINFTGSAPKAFTVQISAANPDTITTLIGKGTLTANTIALQTGEYTLPPVVNVAFGVNSVTFDLIVSRTFLEKNYGKEVALVVKMSDPAKGNSIVPVKNATIIVIKTAEAIAPDAVHYIGFTAAGKQFLVPDGVNYSIGSLDMTIPLELFLTGVAGEEFTVDITPNPDTLTTLINNRTLQNTVLIDPKNYGISTPKVVFPAGKNKVIVNLTAKISALLAIRGKKVAVALTLKDPTRFQTSVSKRTIVAVIDPDFFRPFKGTPFIIPGTIGKASETIYASNYDLGGQGVAFNDDNNRSGGPFRRPDNVDISDNNMTVGWTSNNEWLTYSVIVEEDGEYEFNAIIGAPNDNGRYSLFFGDVNVTGILASKKTPGAYGDQRPNLSTVQLKKGKHIMKFFMNVGQYDVRGFIFTRKK